MKTITDTTILIAGHSRIATALTKYLNTQSLNVQHIQEPSGLSTELKADYIFAFTSDLLEEKIKLLQPLLPALKEGGILTINLDGIQLADVQKNTRRDVLGMNLNFPDQHSPFMEIIRTDQNDDVQIKQLKFFGEHTLKKDPYVVNHGLSARAYMIAAMTREAFYLVDNGYANIESIDRACRNDAGYYLPFTGNFLYMDLMGTMAYALVMKDLNPELANCKELPQWFIEKVKAGKWGMKTKGGLYAYAEGDLEKWEAVIADFSADIDALIRKNIQHYERRLTYE